MMKKVQIQMWKNHADYLSVENEPCFEFAESETLRYAQESLVRSYGLAQWSFILKYDEMPVKLGWKLDGFPEEQIVLEMRLLCDTCGAEIPSRERIRCHEDICKPKEAHVTETNRAVLCGLCNEHSLMVLEISKLSEKRDALRQIAAIQLRAATNALRACAQEDTLPSNPNHPNPDVVPTLPGT